MNYLLSAEVQRIVTHLIKLGLVVNLAECYSIESHAGEDLVEQLIISLCDRYPKSLLGELPVGWDYFNCENETYTGLCGTCMYPVVTHAGFDSLTKVLFYTSFLDWLGEKDVDGVRLVLTLGGYAGDGR